MKIYSISTHAPLAGRDALLWSKSEHHRISTHAPLAGRDGRPSPHRWSSSSFQPTRPLRGATFLSLMLRRCCAVFQPTRPLRGATRPALTSIGRFLHFNPRAPCGARPIMGLLENRAKLFQPTRPLRGATSKSRQRSLCNFYFNPRAPCGARRASASSFEVRSMNFNPRAPCGARLTICRARTTV